MLIIEMVSRADVFKFNPGQSIQVYINEDQIVLIRIAKVIGRKNFVINIDGKKKIIDEVRVVYKG